MAITPLPTPPDRSAPSTFSALADAFIAALPNFVTEANALAIAMNLNATTATSTTSLAIGVGSKSLTVDTAKSYQPGMSVKIARTASPSNWMHGDVTSYDTGTGALVVNVLDILGSGTFTDWTITFSAPNLPFATTTEVKAQTEAGKTISPLTLAALVPALGAANLKQFMNAAGTAPEWANGIKIGQFTRDVNGADGDVSYTSVGFKPSNIIFLAILSGYPMSSMGFDDASSHLSIYTNNSANWAASAGVSIVIIKGTGQQHIGLVKSMDTDGFTITWANTGANTGTANMFYMAFR